MSGVESSGILHHRGGNVRLCKILHNSGCLQRDQLTHDRKLPVPGGLSAISSILRGDWCRLKSREQDRSTESEYESVSSTRMETGTDKLR